MNRFILLLILTTIHVYCASTSQKFIYRASDNVIIEANSSIELEVALSTSLDEYLSESKINATISILQKSSIIQPYSILYFSYQEEGGQYCYKEWILTGFIPLETTCHSLINVNFDQMPSCARFINCSSENISVTIDLT